jgi:Putative lumazine-binding
MKKMFLFILFLGATSFAFAQSDDEAVKNTINSAYIGGIHNGGPIDDIRKGFHPSFIMFILNNNEVKSTTIDEWIGNIEKSRAANTAAPANKAVAKFTSVAVSGTSASVTLDLFRGDKKVFTDNLLLYKFNEGWRIVAKNFYRHP